ncbi:L,D-transpeptidase family protein [Micromonospora sp. CPCC 205711]|uniref:L,D-transpeptidase family protein n=1 Tax=Micromonospora sp. CPCC 205547 TaxID=3122400 RepID=UPI002FF37088
MRTISFAARIAALAVVTLVGAVGCAFDPQADPGGTGGGLAPVGSAEKVTGASGTPRPDQRAPFRPVARPTTTAPKPRATATPTRSATPSPSATATHRPTPSPSASRTTCPQGERQRDVEAYLAELGGFGKVTVDGRQSDADCAAIKKFQQRYDIRPAAGRAGPLTYEVAKRLATTDVQRCHAGSGTTFCVDLTRQTTWVMRNGKLVAGPTVTRTGMSGYATPAGSYTIFNRSLKEWSDPYDVWLPYWQQFNGGIGFHETTTYLHNSAIGSHGCVNLLPTDAVRWWELGRVGATVTLVGRRPGT